MIRLSYCSKLPTQLNRIGLLFLESASVIMNLGQTSISKYEGKKYISLRVYSMSNVLNEEFEPGSPR